MGFVLQLVILLAPLLAPVVPVVVVLVVVDKARADCEDVVVREIGLAHVEIPVIPVRGLHSRVVHR